MDMMKLFILMNFGLMMIYVKLLDLFQVGVHLTVIFDSCFSDNSTDLRFISPVRRIGKAKFFKLMDIPSEVGRKKRILKAHNAVEVLMAGCGDKEYSYDAPRLGNGAFTAYFLKVIYKR